MAEPVAQTLLWIARKMPCRVLFFTRFGIWFQSILWRHWCPGGQGLARECVRRGGCGCDNQDLYPH